MKMYKTFLIVKYSNFTHDQRGQSNEVFILPMTTSAKLLLKKTVEIQHMLLHCLLCVETNNSNLVDQ